MKTQYQVRVGTSGIVLPGNKASFPVEFQAGTRLQYYGSLFNSLEINSSFYKIPKPETFAKWAQEVPDDFLFTVKLWRDVTHAKDLNYPSEGLEMFMHAANSLETKSGCLLVQFPASIRIEHLHRLERLLHSISLLNENNQWQLAIEFRHTSWYQENVYKILAGYNALLVLHDMPQSTAPFSYLNSRFAHPDSIYIRFHGPTGQYNGSYSNQIIDHYVEYIKNWQLSGKKVYVYFNNTIGSALQNAQRLQSSLR